MTTRDKPYRAGWILVLAAACLLPVFPVSVRGECNFKRGNITNETGLDVVDLNDAVDLLAFLFLGTVGAQPDCRDAADVNDNGFVELGDYLYLVRYLMDGGPPPPAPFPERGVDPTPETTVPAERDSRFTFKIGSAIGFPSHTGLEIPIFLSNEVGIDGMQMVIEYDGSVLRLDEIRLEGTALADFSERSYLIYQFFNRDGVSHAGISALLNYDPPLTGQTIAPGEDQLVGVMVVAVQLTAEPQTTQMRFVDGVIFPGAVTDPEVNRAPVENFVIVGTDPIRPVFDTEGGVVEIETAFIRGDSNLDRRIDISDAVFLLQFLFYGASAPECDDAADINNDSKIDLADAIFVLNYLFRGGPQPPAPYPAPGLDPEIGDPAADPLECNI